MLPPLDWSILLSSAPNIVTAVAFAYFVLKLLHRQDQKDIGRDAEWRLYLFNNAKQYLDSISSVTAELKSLVLIVTATHQLVFNHNALELARLTTDNQGRDDKITEAAQAVSSAAKSATAALDKAK